MENRLPRGAKIWQHTNPKKPPLIAEFVTHLTLAVLRDLEADLWSVLLVFLVAKIRTKVSLLVLKQITQNRSQYRELALSLHSRLVRVRH